MRRILTSLALLICCTTAPVAAQSWESPTFFSPRPGEDLGLYAFSPEGLDWGLMGIWRQSGNLSLGVRAGLIEDHVLVGAEFYSPFATGTAAPLLFAWVLGAGATFNDITHLRVPLGISAGVRLGNPGSVQLLPYVHPRVSFDLFAFDDGAGEEQTETEFNVDIDVGADITLTPSLVARLGATFGEFETFGVGLAYRMSRRVEVR